jgi:hypothetical protein
MAQAAYQKQPCLDYPYIGIPDEDEDELMEAGTLTQKELYL